MNTTLARIKACGPCASGWRKLLHHLGSDYPEDQPIPLTTILESNGWRDAVWALQSVSGSDRQIRLFACDCAELVLPEFEQSYPDDKRPRRAIEVARRFAEGLATVEELRAARQAAGVAYAAAAATYASALVATAAVAADAAYDAADAASYNAANATTTYAAATAAAADIESRFRKHFTA